MNFKNWSLAIAVLFNSFSIYANQEITIANIISDSESMEGKTMQFNVVVDNNNQLVGANFYAYDNRESASQLASNSQRRVRLEALWAEKIEMVRNGHTSYRGQDIYSCGDYCEYSLGSILSRKIPVLRKEGFNIILLDGRSLNRVNGGVVEIDYLHSGVRRKGSRHRRHSQSFFIAKNSTGTWCLKNHHGREITVVDFRVNTLFGREVGIDTIRTR